MVTIVDGLKLATIYLPGPGGAISNTELSVLSAAHKEDSGRNIATSVEARECMPLKLTTPSIDAKIAILFISI
jgi:hypothetical protein